tara:strand:- start:156 stop:1388 length:1233 start_codon:yes stop_codon:yes gene_type:complete
MNILFLTILNIKSFSERGIYTDLIKKFEDEGNTVFVVCPNERREKKQPELIKFKNSKILRVRTLNIQKTNLIEKGLATLAIEYQYLFAIKKYFKKTKFDIVIYTTPPITFTKVINFIKKRDKALSYLLLKDIFPQNAVDMNMIKKNGLLHNFFLKKEKNFYAASDYIGCLSQSNVDYLKTHNPDLDFNKLEINPNTINPIHINYSNSEKELIKLKYQIPIDKKIFIFGGNLGKPQGLDFLLETIKKTFRSDVYFLIIGSGTEFIRIKEWFDITKPQNASLISLLPKNDYDKLLAACDVGLIFLNRNFTIPNYPCRLLSYLEMKIPIIAATDPNTDIGMDIQNNKCGFSVISGDSLGMQNAINKLMDNINNFIKMKENSWYFLNKHFHVNRSYELIMEKRKLSQKNNLIKQ